MRAQIGKSCGQDADCYPGLSCIKWTEKLHPGSGQMMTCEVVCPRLKCPFGTHCTHLIHGPKEAICVW